MIDHWWEFGQDTGVTPLLFTRSAMGFLMTTDSQDLGLTSHPKDIYIYAFSRQFYLKQFTVHSGYTFFLSVHVFPGNRTHNLCAANAML